MINRRHAILMTLAALSACGRTPDVTRLNAFEPPLYSGETPELRALINHWADTYQVPRSLFHRVIQRESSYNPSAQHRSYYGLMQIDPRTARTMGHQGDPEDLLDAETNLIYAGKYLRGAWLVSDGDQDEAVRWYASGYYYEAKRRGLLVETGLRSA